MYGFVVTSPTGPFAIGVISRRQTRLPSAVSPKLASTTPHFQTTITTMAHMARGEGYREEQTSDEDDIVSRRGRGRASIGTDKYIESKFHVRLPASTDSM